MVKLNQNTHKKGNVVINTVKKSRRLFLFIFYTIFLALLLHYNTVVDNMIRPMK